MLVAGVRILRGARIDLVDPFPEEYLDRAFQWTKAYAGISLHDDNPADAESFKLSISARYRASTYGVRLHGQDEPVGMVSFEPATARNAYLHIVLSRAVWGKGIGDDAIALAIRHAFETDLDLTRVSVYMLERNRAAQALARRIGFQVEGLFPDMVLQQGIPRGVLHFGLTRREWEKKTQVLCDQEETSNDS